MERQMVGRVIKTNLTRENFKSLWFIKSSQNFLYLMIAAWRLFINFVTINFSFVISRKSFKCIKKNDEKFHKITKNFIKFVKILIKFDGISWHALRFLTSMKDPIHSNRVIAFYIIIRLNGTSLVSLHLFTWAARKHQKRGEFFDGNERKNFHSVWGSFSDGSFSSHESCTCWKRQQQTFFFYFFFIYYILTNSLARSWLISASNYGPKKKTVLFLLLRPSS